MLAQEISMLKAGVAHDMMLIRNGEQGDNFEHLKYVCFDKLSPKFNMVQVLMKNIAAVEEPTTGRGRPPKNVTTGEKETLPIAGELEPEGEPLPEDGKTVNMFEKISREVQSAGARR